MILIQALVTLKVFGISNSVGIKHTISKLVHAPNINMAKNKFESYVWEILAHAQAESMTFDYLIIADELP